MFDILSNWRLVLYQIIIRLIISFVFKSNLANICLSL